METIFNTAADANAPTHWYAVQTRSRHEKALAARLEAQAIEIFLPLHRSVHRWRNGVSAHVDAPLFPCYLFVRCSAYDRLKILKTPGVVGFAASTVSPTILQDEDMEVLKVITAAFKTEPHPYLHTGDRVQVVSGPLAGMEGMLTRRKQEYRVVISIEAIARSIAVEVSEFDIVPMKQAAEYLSVKHGDILPC